jgi:hypothetical protein
MRDKTNPDNRKYFHFAGPARLSKAVHELEGLLLGITADAIVNNDEMIRLTKWLGEYNEFADFQPFNEVIGMLEASLADATITDEEMADLLWLCTQWSDDSGYYSAMTKDLQRLQGILSGIATDRRVSQIELDALQGWMDEHDYLRTYWPYAELESLIVHVLKDGVITEDEHAALLAFFNHFTVDGGHKAVSIGDELQQFCVGGVCAVDPKIEFTNKVFCFTGTTTRCPRSELETLITGRGGIFSKTLVQKTDYLIVGADGNPCWAFSCYGRKVEQRCN